MAKRNPLLDDSRLEDLRKEFDARLLELQAGLDEMIPKDEDGNKAIRDWREICFIALEDVLDSKNPDVGPVIMIHVKVMTSIWYVKYGYEFNIDKWIKDGIKGFEKVFGVSSQTTDYERVVELINGETEDMALERITRAEAVDMVVSQAKTMKYTQENFERLYADLSVFSKMFGGFAIDCAKKSGTFEIPYAEDVQKGLDVRIKRLDERFFNAVVWKDDEKRLKAKDFELISGENGIRFGVTKPAAETFRWYGKENPKMCFNDPVAQSMDQALQQVKTAIKDFYGKLNLPKFSELTKSYIERNLERSDEDAKEFFVAVTAAKYMVELWLTLTSWKSDAIYRLKAVGGDDDDILAIKKAVTPGFRRIKAENIRVIQHVFRAMTGNSAKADKVAAVALAACFTDKMLKWISKETDYSISALTMASEYVNLFMYRAMKSKGVKVTQFAREDVVSLNGFDKGMKLDFVDGEASYQQEDGEESWAKVLNTKVQGQWELGQDEHDNWVVRKPVEEILEEELPQGNESIHVFCSIPDADQHDRTLGNELERAQATHSRVTLAYRANARQAGETGNAIVIGDRIVGRYRTPYVDQKKYGRTAYDALVTAVGGVEGEVERSFTYFSKEKDTYITVCVLKDVVKLDPVKDRAKLYPVNLINQIRADKKAKSEQFQVQSDNITKSLAIKGLFR